MVGRKAEFIVARRVCNVSAGILLDACYLKLSHDSSRVFSHFDFLYIFGIPYWCLPYCRRSKQSACFARVVQVYETEPNNFAKLMELMQEVQEYGQPPSEIIREIAPDIELDANGVPKMGEGDFMGGIPNMGQEECRIM